MANRKSAHIPRTDTISAVEDPEDLYRRNRQPQKATLNAVREEQRAEEQPTSSNNM